jgi:hypothetical protein
MRSLTMIACGLLIAAPLASLAPQARADNDFLNQAQKFFNNKGDDDDAYRRGRDDEVRREQAERDRDRWRREHDRDWSRNDRDRYSDDRYRDPNDGYNRR